jgi:hypothetical protein
MSHKNKNKILLSISIFIYAVVNGCSQRNSSITPAFTITDNSFLIVTSSLVSKVTQTAIPTTPTEFIEPNCKIANEEGQLYLLSDQEFRNLRTTVGKLNQALATHYPEWEKS